MNELELVDQLIHYCRLTSAASNYFQSDIRWLEERKVFWSRSHIQLGLIGVTSSGKSTFINALLGKALLPAAVRPSSGILITCVRGDQEKAIVHFEGKPSQRLTGKRLTMDLEGYADEKFNPENRKLVSSIELQSPHFAIDSSIKIIDSPGLEAYGLERHEALTMETLLPHVDGCLYMTTLKTNSDESTYKIVKSIHEHSKPLIIIQNMLDSVVSKKGVRGETLKRAEDVADDLRQRVQRIVSKVSPSLANQVQIVQVSARQALDGKVQKKESLYKQSRFDTLIRSVQEQVDVLKPVFRANRLRQIKHHFDELFQMEGMNSGASNGTGTKADNQFDSMFQEIQADKAQEAALNDKYYQTMSKMQQTIKEIAAMYSTTINEIEQLDKKNVSQAQRVLDQLKGQTEACERSIIEAMRQLDRLLIERCRKLNLNLDDYKSEMLPVKKRENAFKLKKRFTQERRREKSDEFLGGAKRWFGSLFDTNWGYVYRIYDVEIIDFDALREHLMNHLRLVTEPLQHFTKTSETRVLQFLTLFEEELQRREDDLIAKKNAVTERKDIDQILMLIYQALKQSGLSETLENVRSDSNATKRAARRPKSPSSASFNNRSEAERSFIEVKPPVLSLFYLSEFIVKSYFATIFSFVQVQNAERMKFDTTVIWGWDNQAVTDFCHRFLHPHVSDKDLEGFSKSGWIFKSIAGHKYVMVNEVELDPTLQKQLEQTMNHSPYNVYLLVNSMQQGAAIRQVKESLLLSYTRSDRAIVNWVSQSFREFIHAKNTEEGIRSLMDISNHFAQPRGTYLINEFNPIYSLFLTEVAGLSKVTLPDVMKISQKLKSICPQLAGHEELEVCASLARPYIR